MGNPILFGILAVIALSAAVGMVASRNAIYSALFLILNMITIAVLYLVLNAPFMAMVQITVYAGAIMVLFLFVIMLLGAERIGRHLERCAASCRGYWLGRCCSLVLAVVTINQGSGGSAATAIDASPAAVGLALFASTYFPFEVTAVLLLVALIGVVVWQTRRR